MINDTSGSVVPHVNAVRTAVPRHDVHDTFLHFARRMLPDDRTRRVFDRMADRSGVAHRFSTLRPADTEGASLDDKGFYTRGAFPGTGARMAAYEAEAPGLAIAAVRRLDPGPVTHVVVASCTGFMAPGLDQRIVDAMGLGDTVQRTCVGFMGCYAAVPALRLAYQAVRSDPAARVLVVMTEMCTLHLQETQDLETVLSFLIFGDGAAAALVTAEPTGLAMQGFHSQLIPDTPELITWRIGDQGFDMHLSGKVPGVIAAALRTEAARQDGGGMLAGRAPTEFRHWAVHAGGRTVLDAVEQGLGLAGTALDHSRAVLRDIGNVSSATLGFVLERMLAAREPGPGLAVAFGPGLCAESFAFEVV